MVCLGSNDLIIHLLLNPVGPGGMINIHTHGMEKYDHMDFQLVFPAESQLVRHILDTLEARVQNGERFKPGDLVYGLFDDCCVRLDLVWETRRQVLRLIIPDAHNRFPEEPMCEAPYKYQTQIMFEI